MLSLPSLSCFGWWGREYPQDAGSFFECLGLGFPVNGGVPVLFFSFLRRVSGLRGLTTG